MGKVIKILLLLVAVMGIAWAGSVYYVGRQVEAVMVDYETAFLQTGEVAVHRMEYQPGFLQGQLHYDLEWQPGTDSQVGAIATVLQEFGEVELRTSGVIDVHHGPYVGGPTPLALARMEWEYQLPAKLRMSLPQYPGNAPLLAVTSIINLDGSLQSQLTGVNYNGTLVEGGETLSLELTGLTGTLEVDNRSEAAHVTLGLGRLEMSPGNDEVLAWENINVDVAVAGATPKLDLNAGIGRFRMFFEEENFDFDIQNLTVQGNSTQVRPAIWAGNSTFGLSLIDMDIEGFAGALRNISGTTLTRISGTGQYEAFSETLVSEIEFGGNVVNDFRFDMSMRNIDVEAYSRIAQVTTDLEAALSSPDLLMSTILESANDILAGQPILSLDRLSLSVNDSEDIRLSSSITYTGDADFNSMADQSELIDGVEFEADVSLAVPAVRHLIGLGLSTLDPSMSGSSLDNAVDANYDNLLAMLEGTEMMNITSDEISTTMAMREGQISINGVEYSSLDEMMGMFSSEPAGYGSSVAGPVEILPEFSQEPRFERLNLAAGFGPDPRSIPMVASGQAMVYEILGVDCAGNVKSAIPDITLTYEAVPGTSLYIYAESTSDTTLMVLTPDGWHCDDDSHGDFNPGITITRPSSGDYVIWVGTYDQGAAKAQLSISER